VTPDTELWSWDSLDIALYDLAGQYRPRHEGDGMLVNYESKNLRDTENFLWRYRGGGVATPGMPFTTFPVTFLMGSIGSGISRYRAHYCFFSPDFRS